MVTKVDASLLLLLELRLALLAWVGRYQSTPCTSKGSAR